MKKKVAFKEAETLKKNSDNGFLSFKIAISLLVLLPITTATNSNPSVFNTWYNCTHALDKKKFGRNETSKIANWCSLYSFLESPYAF